MKINNYIKYNELADIFSCMSHPIRLKILEELYKCCKEQSCKDGKCVFEINNIINIPQPILSKHLKILKAHNLISYKRQGNKIYYSLENDLISKIFLFLEQTETKLIWS